MMVPPLTSQYLNLTKNSSLGVAIAYPDLVNVFRPFYRVADSRERETGGVGLGLAITDHAVRLHGGVVCARNSPSGGLIIELRLPAISQPTALLHKHSSQKSALIG